MLVVLWPILIAVCAFLVHNAHLIRIGWWLHNSIQKIFRDC